MSDNHNGYNGANVIPSTPFDVASLLWNQPVPIRTIPVAYGEKAPGFADWGEHRTDPYRDHYGKQTNVGIPLGFCNSGWTDTDFDCAEAIYLANLFLPPSTSFGRRSRRASHRLFITNIATKQFKDPIDGGKKMLVEIRSDGCQTVLPGSTHPEGELVEFEPGTIFPPVHIDPLEYLQRVQAIAAFSLAAKHWPSSGRHELQLGLAGVLLQLGYSDEFATEVLCAVCALAGDEDRPKRQQTVTSTRARKDAGEKFVSWGAVFKHLPRSVAVQMRKWLGVDEKPVIIISADLQKLIDEMLQAMSMHCYEVPESRLYKNDSGLVRIVRAEPPKNEDKIKRETGSPTIEVVPLSQITLFASSSAFFYKIKKNKEGNETRTRTLPAPSVAQTIAELRHYPQFGALELFTETPVLLADGTIMQTPGYDEESGVCYEPKAGFSYGFIAERPTDVDIRQAIEEFEAAIGEFRFVTPEHKTAFYAACLTPLAHLTHAGKVPLILLGSPVRGAGKSYLAKIIGLVGTGHVPAASQFSADDAEMRKRITSHAVAGDRVVMLDNVGDGIVLGGDALCTAITEPFWEDRILGTNRNFKGPLRVTFLATANNCEIGPDMDRRILPITIDPRVENPEALNFKIKDIMEYVMKNRARLATAALTLLRAYHAAGCPDVPMQPWGGFESWKKASLAPLVWLGFPDPIPARRELRSADTTAEHRRMFTSAFRDYIAIEQQRAQQQNRLVPQGVTAAQLATAVRMGEPRLREALEGILTLKAQQDINSTQISSVLRRVKDKVIGGYIIVRAGEDTTNNVAIWTVVRA